MTYIVHHKPTENLTARIGRWSAQHRRMAIAGWLAFVIGLTAIGMAVGTNTLDGYAGTGASGVADQAIERGGFRDEAVEQVLVQSRDGEQVTSPAIAAAVADTVHRLRSTPHVTDVLAPHAARHRELRSKDGRSALITFKVAGDSDLAVARVAGVQDAVAAAQAAHPGARIEQYGEASAGKAASETLDKDFKRAELLSLPITMVVLILAFGALVAAGLPLLLALTAIAATLGVLGPVSQLMPLDPSASSVVLLIGLAVGVDYSMFYLRREMEERDAGLDHEAALNAAAATSGRAVLISGVTVMVAMGGLLFAGTAGFTSLGVSAMLVVAAAVLGSLTVLPATLSWLSQKGWTEKGRVPWIAHRRHRHDDDSGVLARLLDGVLRRPLVSTLLAGGLLVALAVPALGIHTITTGDQGLPRTLPVMQTYDRITTAFPGGPIPAVVAIEADDVTAPAVRSGVTALKAAALATGRMSDPITTTTNPGKTLIVVNIPLQGDGTDAASDAALDALRGEVIPHTIDRVPGTAVHVTGLTAGSRDFNDNTKEKLPVVFAFVLGLAFLLLLVTFRSIVVPVVAIALNLLSVGAAYGVLKLVFQDGHGEQLLGFESLGGITSWLPLFLFVILFGLSMDYHVFILSRMREAYDRGLSNEDAVSHGIKSSAGIVSSAAAVMVGVFAVFATLSSLDFKQMGVGLAVAVLIDATIVRAVLLPAVMKLLGDANWYLPKSLSWLPQVEPERPLPPVAVPA
jgi:uncharacterized membrane protein YdfJ with MMPL/SSD domain